jgi:hypothetical protein
MSATPGKLQDDAGAPAGCVPMPACELKSLRSMIERKRAIVAQEKWQGKTTAKPWPVGAHAFQPLSLFAFSPFAMPLSLKCVA